MANDTEKKGTQSAGDGGMKDDGDKGGEKKAAPADGEKKGQGGAKDGGGELADVFDQPGEKGKEEPAAKGGDLKLSVPDDLKDLFGKPDDYVAAAREAGLNQQQLDKVGAVLFDRVKAAAQEGDQEAERISLEWRRELMGDQKLGGAKLKETMLTADRGARALGGAALAIAVAKHLKGEEVIPGPMLIRALHLAGLDQNEDRLGERGQVPTTDANLTPEQRRMHKRYPSHYQQRGASK